MSEIEEMRSRLLGIEPEPTLSKENEADLRVQDTGYFPKDLLSVEVDPEKKAPTLFTLEDGSSLLYAGKVHSLIGVGEAGKSMMCLIPVKEVLDRGGRVLWIDYEDTEEAFVTRLEEFGIPRSQWDRIDYLNPSKNLFSRQTNQTTKGWSDLQELVKARKHELAIIDAMTGAMSLDGLNTNYDGDVEQTYKWLTAPLAEQGVTVVVIDHLAKNPEGRYDSAIGSIRKKTGITGATFLAEVGERWSRPDGREPSYGRIDLRILRDRVGYLRQGNKQDGDVIASIEVCATPDGMIDLRPKRPHQVSSKTSNRKWAEILDYLDGADGASKSEVYEAVKGNKSDFLRTIREMVKKGLIRDNGTGSRSSLVRVEELIRIHGYD